VVFLTPRAWARYIQWVRLHTRRRTRLVVLALAVLAVSPVVLINLAAAYFGNSIIFPLSPFFLGQKVSALGTYAAHRPFCAITGHPEVLPLIRSAEARNKLPRGLLAAIVQVESAGKPHRISSAGAMGLGQLMPGTARQLGVSDPFDSAANIDGAARLMAENLRRFRGNISFAVAAYNAGPGAVNGRIPQNGQTPGYVAKVMRIYGEGRRARARTVTLAD
jgi:soluble lytic murein transglycosylase-like protein